MTEHMVVVLVWTECSVTAALEDFTPTETNNSSYFSLQENNIMKLLLFTLKSKSVFVTEKMSLMITECYIHVTVSVWIWQLDRQKSLRDFSPQCDPDGDASRL